MNKETQGNHFEREVQVKTNEIYTPDLYESSLCRQRTFPNNYLITPGSDSLCIFMKKLILRFSRIPPTLINAEKFIKKL